MSAYAKCFGGSFIYWWNVGFVGCKRHWRDSFKKLMVKPRTTLYNWNHCRWICLEITPQIPITIHYGSVESVAPNPVEWLKVLMEEIIGFLNSRCRCASNGFVTENHGWIKAIILVLRNFRRWWHLDKHYS
jgi:hypothetical protein